MNAWAILLPSLRDVEGRWLRRERLQPVHVLFMGLPCQAGIRIVTECDSPDLAVVVVTHNQHDVLRQCLRSVQEALKDLSGELVVVDNASVDATPRVLAEEFPQVRVIRNETNLHYTRAMNQGMRSTGGRYVFLLNDDTEVKPDCLRNAIAFMDDHPRCGTLGPKLVSPTGEAQVSAQKFPTPLREIMAVTGVAWHLREKAWAARWQREYPMPMQTQIVDWVCGGAIFFRRSAMEELGLHDEQYLFYRDDPDIGMRMKATGREVWYLAEACVVHHHGMSTVKTDSRVRFDLIAVRSRRHYHRKFHGVLAVGLVEGVCGLFALLRAFKSLVLLRFRAAAEQVRAFLLLFGALAVPREEKEAIAGYRTASYNGMPASVEKKTGGVPWGGAVGSESVYEKVDALPSRDREGAVDAVDPGPLPYGRGSERTSHTRSEMK